MEARAFRKRRGSRRPRIGLDLTLLRPGRTTGIERYAARLASELVALDSPFDWVLFYAPRMRPLLGPQRAGVEPCVSPTNLRLVTDQLWLPWACRRAGVDLLHCPAFPAPPLYRGRFVQTVHDAAMWRIRGCVSSGTRWYYRPMFPRAIRRAARIVTVSHFSQRELCTLFDLPPDRVVPIWNGLTEAPSGEGALAVPEGPFVLTVGTIEPRKNLPVLLEAMRRLPERHRGVELVVAGRRGWQSSPILRRGAAAPVRWLGPVDDASLWNLYRTATLFLLPSLYEGFGLALVEAMSQGTPAVASRAGSLPEVGGDACWWVDPASPAEWADAITRLLDDPDLRTRLASRGLERSREFDWKQTARAVLGVYRDVMELGAR